MDYSRLLLAVIVGYGVFGFLPIFIIKEIVNRQHKRLIVEGRIDEQLSALIGIVERIIYSTAVIVGTYELIAVWLVLKAALQWSSATRIDANAYSIYIFGTGLSLIFGVLGGLSFLAIIANH